jgi:hypothetical protein
MSGGDPTGPGYSELQPMAAAPDQKPAKGKDQWPGVVLAFAAIATLLVIVGFLVYVSIALGSM